MFDKNVLLMQILHPHLWPHNSEFEITMATTKNFNFHSECRKAMIVVNDCKDCFPHILAWKMTLTWIARAWALQVPRLPVSNGSGDCCPGSWTVHLAQALLPFQVVLEQWQWVADKVAFLLTGDFASWQTPCKAEIVSSKSEVALLLTI